VREGICWKLFSKTLELAHDQLAEVHRVPLEQCVLQVASMDLSMGIIPFFDALVDPPAHKNVESAVESLAMIGAIEGDTPNRLTPLGEHLAKLPMDAKLGKMLVFASLLGVPEDCATIAAALSRRSVFLNVLPEKRDEARQAKRQLSLQGVSHAAQSDHLVLIPAMEGWRACKSRKERAQYCSDNFLSDDGMQEVFKLRTEFLDAIENAGFNARDDALGGDNEILLDNLTRKKHLLKASLCAGLYPNVVKIRRPDKRYIETRGGALEAQAAPKELRFELIEEFSSNRDTKRVFLHPSSVNMELSTFNSSWMVYSELVQTSKAFVRDCTVVAPYGLLLFGGPLQVLHEDGIITVGKQKVLRFKMHARVAVLIKELKKLLDAFLMEKLANPTMNTTDSRVLDACKRLIVGRGFF
jgi:ATP-dependent RNA helicase DHX57